MELALTVAVILALVLWYRNRRTALKVLVIDDEYDRQDWFLGTLQRTGLKMRITQAHNDTEAMIAFRDNKFDLAFFDHDLGQWSDNGSIIAGKVRILHTEYNCPKAVIVHSMNYQGARNIASKFNDIPTAVISFDTLMDSTPKNVKETIQALLK